MCPIVAVAPRTLPWACQGHRHPWSALIQLFLMRPYTQGENPSVDHLVLRGDWRTLTSPLPVYFLTGQFLAVEFIRHLVGYFGACLWGGQPLAH